MRDIDNDAKTVAAANDLGAGIGQPIVYRGLGLDITQFVDAVMGELQMAEVPFGVRLIDAIDLAFQEIGALGGDDRGRGAGFGGAQIGGGADDRQALLLRQRMHAAEGELRVLIQLAGVRLAVGMDAAVRHDAVRRPVGHHGVADHRHAALPHRLGDRVEGPPRTHSERAGDAAGVAVDVHRGRRLKRGPAPRPDAAGRRPACWRRRRGTSAARRPASAAR